MSTNYNGISESGAKNKPKIPKITSSRMLFVSKYQFKPFSGLFVCPISPGTVSSQGDVSI